MEINKLDKQIMEYGHVLKLTKEEFIQQECEALGITLEEYNKRYDHITECLPDCDYMYCQGWRYW